MSAGNSIFRILVQRKNGLWVFDDERFGIVEQPFVFGADLILEKMAAQSGVNGERLNAVFAGIPFPGSEYTLRFVREETEGFMYRWEEENLQSWLSPSLKNYFPEPPPEIYLQLLTAE